VCSSRWLRLSDQRDIGHALGAQRVKAPRRKGGGKGKSHRGQKVLAVGFGIGIVGVVTPLHPHIRIIAHIR